MRREKNIAYLQKELKKEHGQAVLYDSLQTIRSSTKAIDVIEQLNDGTITNALLDKLVRDYEGRRSRKPRKLPI
jgi:hypothetical protein